MKPQAALPVKINIASAKEIDALYDVGAIMAQRIVEYRETKGFFRCPEDLANVEGMNLNLAQTLSPHIDWQTPGNADNLNADNLKERDWVSAFLYFLFGVGITAHVYYRRIPDFLYHLKEYLGGFRGGWTWLWIQTSLSAASLFGIAWVVFMLLQDLTTDQRRGRNYGRASILMLWIATLFLISTALGNAVFYSFYSYKGWNELFEVPENLLAAIGGFSGCLGALPLFLVSRKPGLASSAICRGIFDVGYVLSGPAVILTLWLGETVFPWWANILWLFFGGMFSYFGLQVIRTGQSFFSLSIDTYHLLDSDDRGKFSAKWQYWINKNLPNPEQQKELLEALNKMHSPSKLRALAGVIVFTAGGWLIISSLGAVLEWIVQKGLDKLFIK